MKYSKAPRGLLCLFACLSFINYASGNLIGFDFGSSFFKVTLVQPGNPF